MVPARTASGHRLVERGLVGEPGIEVDDVLGVDASCVERRRPGAGGLLAEAVPVVGVRDPRLVGTDDGDHLDAVVGALGEGVDPVGEDAPVE